jgi:uncharacterized protein (TIGR03083 family)
VDRERVFAATAAERRRLADLIDDLDDAQLATPSLCAGWDVKTVAAHLVSTLTDGLPGILRRAARRGGTARAIDELARRQAERPAAEIAAELRRLADKRWSPPPHGPRDPLADVLVHGGDIRVPLGLAFEPNPALAAVALDFLTGPWPIGMMPRGRLRGISLHDTASDRVWRKGAEIRGPAGVLMMAAVGRTAFLDQLGGPGLPVLRQRLSA